MAPFLMFAIAAHRKLRRVGKDRQQLQIVPGLGLRHLRPVLPLKSRPLRWRHHCVSEFHRSHRRSEIRKPNVVPVLGRKLSLRHTPRRPTYRTDSGAFSGCARTSQTDNANAHGSMIFPKRIIHPYVDGRQWNAGCGVGMATHETRPQALTWIGLGRLCSRRSYSLVGAQSCLPCRSLERRLVAP